MDFVDFVYRKWLIDTAKGTTNLSFDEYLALYK